MDLELATLKDIMEELGNRSAYGDFIFFDGDEFLIGKDHTPESLMKFAHHIATIARSYNADESEGA